MRFFFRFLQALVILIIMVVVTFLIAAITLKPRVDRELQELIQETQGRSFEVSFLNYGKLRPSGLGFVAGPVRAKGLTRVEHPYFDPRELEIMVSRMGISVKKLTVQSIIVSAHIMGLEIKGGQRLHEDKEDHERLESVSKVNYETLLELSWNPMEWKSQIISCAKEFKAWVFDDRPIYDVKLDGSAVFIVDDWPLTVKFHSTKNEAEAVQLEGDPEDLRVIAEMIEPKFTDADLNLASKNLLKAPKLLRFRVAAENQAQRLHLRDPEVRYDVPRHIYWSYYLTQAYGEAFAQEATNAHEIGDRLNSAAESDKDRHHNMLGIEYAKRKLSEEEVEKLIFSDPRVIRFTKDGKIKKTAA